MREYGLLMYDISQTNHNIYNKVRGRISKYAIPLNLSVYLVDWGLKQTIEKLINQYLLPGVNIKFVKFDSSSNQELLDLAQKSLSQMMNKIEQYISEKKMVVTTLDENKKHFLKLKIERRLSKIKNLIILYGFVGELSPVFDNLLKVYKLEIQSR